MVKSYLVPHESKNYNGSEILNEGLSFSGQGSFHGTFSMSR